MRLACLLLLVVAACNRGEAPIGGDPALPGVAIVDAALTARLRDATALHGPPYHTRNLGPDGLPRFTNRLALEASPYLLQHAHNPLSWYPWGDEAFARARREHKLVLLSIGYSTCHWCHVMEADSFEDEEVARYINANFVCIKVDREERPDLDALYMQALVALTGDGGWPMTIVANAERQPVFGASFLPKAKLLSTLAQLRAADPAKLDELAHQLTTALARDEAAGSGAGGMPGPDAIAAAVHALARGYDPVYGGFGRNRKFPSVPDLELLLRFQRRAHDGSVLAMVTHTLDAMIAGGIHDHVGGGFHRYATDRQWLVPHFEKMTYDNAQLAIVYTEAAQITGRAEYAATARETLDYMLREMAAPEGGFYAATDADSTAPDGTSVEGYFFTWTAAEIDAALGAEAGAAVRATLDVGPEVGTDDVGAARSSRLGGRAAVGSRSVLHGGAISEDARAALLAARAKRTPPLRDDKLVASWNGLAISALAKAGFAFDRADYTRAAVRAATAVLAKLGDADGGLHRSFVGSDLGGGQARERGTLDDYAFVIAGLLDLFEATGDRTWLERAVALAAQLEARFADPAAGGYFTTDAAGEQLWTREKPSDDGAEPSGNAIAVADLLRLDVLTGDATYRARAERALAAFAPTHPGLLAALDQALDAPAEIVIVAPHDVAEAALLVAEVRKVYQPGRTLVVATDATAPEGKHAVDGKPTAFVCERTRCKQPTSDPAVLATQLAIVKPLLLQ